METKVRIFLSKSHASRVKTLIDRGSKKLKVPVKVTAEGKVREGELEIEVDDGGTATLKLDGKKVRQTFKVR